MQFEDALSKQKAGLLAIEEKRFADAVELFTEALSLVPREKTQDKCMFLPDRALALIEIKEYDRAIADCDEVRYYSIISILTSIIIDIQLVDIDNIHTK